MTIQEFNEEQRREIFESGTYDAGSQRSEKKIQYNVKNTGLSISECAQIFGLTLKQAQSARNLTYGEVMQMKGAL